MGAVGSVGFGDIPKQLFGYEVVDHIGEGAGSHVYAVTQPGSGQVYALKHVRRTDEKDVRFIEQLENEYAVSQHFAHPGLRRSIDVKVLRNLLRKPTEAALVMELFDGIPLGDRDRNDVPGTVAVFLQVAEALASLNDRGYVHCDLKPGNILVGFDGLAKVIDFGQACPIGTTKPRIQGTPDFIAPEQVRCAPVTVQTDVFNFGATLYWALCGKHLPTACTVGKGENSFLFDDVMATPASICQNVPPPLSDLVMECVKTNPAKRPADLKVVARRLEVIRYGLHKDDAVAQVVRGQQVA